MKVPQGGTQMWCPYCESVQVCAAVGLASLGRPSGQRRYRSDHEDIQWFRRGRVCQACDNDWLTAELPESFLKELVELRNALSDVKRNAEAYIKESNKASASLKKLSSSLSVLRALDVYQAE